MKTNQQLQKELNDIRAVIPEGYLIARNTLAKSVALMAGGLVAYSNERRELFEELRIKDAVISDLQGELLKIGYHEDNIP